MTPAAGAPQTWTFDYTGGVQQFTVPDDVKNLTMIVVGGAGGPAGSFQGNPGVSSAVVGTLDVSPGQELTVWVGGGGENGGEGGSPPGLGGWGFGCGGRGGVASNFLAGNGNGGGGASAVTESFSVGDGDCSSNRPLSDQIYAVAGGSGGGGGDVVVPAASGLGNQVELGGQGGDSGDQPTAGGGGSDGTAPGGCAACSGSHNGQQGSDDPDSAFSGAGGGGGGGWVGGDGGFVANAFFGGGGGGGAFSIVGTDVDDVGFIAGTSSGNGSVTLTAGSGALFNCTGDVQSATVPAGAGWMAINAQGGHGGARDSDEGGPGGTAGLTEATVQVENGSDVGVYVGCAGTRDPGWGFGNGGAAGDAPDHAPFDGAAGGGSSAVLTDDNVVVLAGGGGAGGGDGGVFGQTGGGGNGGTGGSGGNPPSAGSKAQPDDYAGGDGGCGGCVNSLTGGTGGTSGHASEGGGGGGGGAGWYSGGGGHEGRLDITLDGGGGGGGGAGLNHIIGGAQDTTSGTSSLGGDGIVDLVFTPDTPTLVSAYEGSGQTTTIGGTFGTPLIALVTDASGFPVGDVTVSFALPGSGASGTFAGGGTTHQVTTNENGLAASPLVTANLTAGGWTASASVTGIATPALFSLKNVPVATTTTVTASSDPATPTEEVTFTAKVTPATTSAGTPDGDVQFQVDGVDLGGPTPLTNGQATSEPIIGLEVGTRTITAEYAGNDDYLASTGTLALPVELTPTATAVSSSINPSIPTEAVTFTATITVPPGNTPYSGTVQFFVDGSEFGPPVAATDGTAPSGSIDSLALGPHEIMAVTGATSDYVGSIGTMTQQVDPDATAVNVTTPTNPIQYGVPIDLDATVVPRPGGDLVPTGTVTFTVDGGSGCEGTLAPAPPDATTSCTLPAPLSPASYDIVGAYSGDTDFDPSSGSLVLQVTKAKTTTTVTGNPAGSSIFGQPVTFTADVTRVVPGSGTPTGTVQFSLDGTSFGSPVALSGGEATSTAITPPAGAHTVTAVYSGDVSFSGSTGNVAHPVEPAPTTTVVAAIPEPSQEGQPVAFIADVTAIVPGATVVPTGSVRFRVDGTPFGDPVPLVNGRAVSPERDDLDHGVHLVSAHYVPDTGDFLASHATIDHDVREPSATVVAASENPAVVGSPVELFAHVGPKATAGTVDFFYDGVPLEGCLLVPVVESEAKCSFTPRSASTHEVLAVFSGAPTLDPSSGTLVLELVVGLRPTFTG